MDKVCGLDVHKDSVFACILDEKGKIFLEERYGVLTPDLDRLRDVLVHHGVGRVAMESTSIYWIPVHRVLASDFDITVVNPYFIKQLPGRKTDVKDAHWIAQCLQKDLIRGSFVPDEELQQMRQYSRRYFYLNRNKVRVEQRIDNHLQRCNIRFSNYIANQGDNVSMRKFIKAIIDGERDPDKLCRLIHGRTTNKHGKDVITSSLTGVLTDTDIEMLKQCMDELDLIEKQQSKCIESLEESANKRYAEEISLLCTMPSIKKLSALLILAELGGDMDAFYCASMLVSWAGLRPRNDESAGKIRSRKTLHGNKYLRKILVEVSWSASLSNKTFLGNKYRQLAKRMIHQKALLAIARKLLVIIYNILAKKQPFDHNKNKQATKATTVATAKIAKTAKTA
jgi:transposase